MKTTPTGSVTVFDPTQSWARVPVVANDCAPCLTGGSAIVKVSNTNGKPTARALLPIEQLCLQGDLLIVLVARMPMCPHELKCALHVHSADVST